MSTGLSFIILSRITTLYVSWPPQCLYLALSSATNLYLMILSFSSRFSSTWLMYLVCSLPAYVYPVLNLLCSNSAIRSTCPIHFSQLTLIVWNMSTALYMLCSPKLYIRRHSPFIHIPLYICRSIFFSKRTRYIGQF